MYVCMYGFVGSLRIFVRRGSDTCKEKLDVELRYYFLVIN